MSGADRLSIRAAALALDDGGRDKPDTKQDVFADLGSPVSPLRLRPGAAATPSSSSSSAGSAKSPALCNAAGGVGRGGGPGSHSGELVAEGNPPRPPGHRRSGSGPLIFSGGSSSAGSGGGGCGGGSTASSPLTNALPTGNICPAGRVASAAPAPPRRARPDVLGSGTGHYGHGSIMRGGGGMAPARCSIDASPFHGNLSRSAASCPAPQGSSGSLQELTRAGNEWYKKGHYGEALRHYDQAVALCPDSAACRSNRAAALIGLGRLAEALRECEEAIRRDPASGRAHSRLAALCLRFGMVERARKHFMLAGQANQSDSAEFQRLQEMERHLGRCMDARKTGDWKSALREADAAIANGADSSQLLLALRSEALLRLNKLEEADSTITSLLKLDSASLSSMSTKLSGMVADSYVHVVQAQVNMAFGRFDTAITMAEKARIIDPGNTEVGRITNNIRLVAQARGQGNELFKAGKFAEASIAYGEGLKYEPSNPVLYCNRAACWSKLGHWVKSVEDCNEALKIQPGYTKALLRRAASYAKLERWADCVRDYEVLRKELPSDTEVAESLFHAQVALKTARGEEVANMKFGGEVETVTSIEQLRDAIHSPGVSVVYFMATMNPQCQQITPSVDSLCSECPSVNFLKVNVDDSPMVARMENVRIVPTFKIYKDGARVKEMICPSLHILRYSVKHYAVSSS
ncbi:TPR repeat-containing thioredoxin TTL1-like [Oryza brachyantha]|uniref:TPR repeat-containing thioredoxin TTL1-like n=1 Tax=Oryza brachyantha TaxID=4533 RepID=UPI001ADBE9CC|nr:TPR repeat-containing thioredoxin TTL1-like [Oryza brachyantha]XP_040380183.1 TPR repeat-containing thioredoxin TTL1-like [Oryza brachyantha]